ncbi:flippase [Patescibacteria group bacterium AH-259-L07]|nr:flippase [Patescibacteria group bacterium AH-259-L07]
MNLTRVIARNTSIHFVGKGISLFLMLASFALIARYLGQLGFGQFTTVMAYLQVFAIFSDMGLYMIFITMLSQKTEDETQLVGNFFTFRIIASIVVLLIGMVIAYFIPQYTYVIKLGIAVTALSFLFGSLIQLFTGFFQKKLKMTYVVYAEVIGRVCLVGLIIGIIWLKLGLLSILSAVVISGFIIFLLLFMFVYKFIPVSLQFDLSLWRTILKKTWPVGLSIILTTIYFKGDTIILSLFRPFEEVGIYGAAYRILEALIMFPPIFMGLVLAPLAHAWAKKDMSRFKRIYQKSFDFFIILILPLVVGTLFLAKPLMILIAGNEFAISAGPLKVLVFATAFIFLGSLTTYTIIALEKQKIMLKFYIVAAMIALVGYLIFIPKYSYWGAAYMTIIAEFLVTAPAIFIIWRTTRILPSFQIFIKALFASLIMGVALYLFSGAHLLLLILLSIIVYFVFLYVFGGLSLKTIKEIVKA